MTKLTSVFLKLTAEGHMKKKAIKFLRFCLRSSQSPSPDTGSASHIPSVYTGFLCVRIRSLWSFLRKQRPLPLLILPTTLLDLSSSSRSWPAEGCRRFHRASREGWQRFTEQPVKMLMLNVQMFRSEVTLKGKHVFGPRQKWWGGVDMQMHSAPLRSGSERPR